MRKIMGPGVSSVSHVRRQIAEGISGVRLRERWDLLDFCAMGDGREAEKNTVPEWRAGDSKIGDVVYGMS